MNYFIIFGVISVYLVSSTPTVEPANIVAFYTFDIKSHYIFAQNCLKELARSGHNVTVFTSFQSSNLPENYREVHLTMGSLDEFKKKMAKDGSVLSLLSSFNKFKEFYLNSTKAIINNDEIQSMIRSKTKVDVVVMNFGDNPMLMGVVKQFGAPLVVTSPQKLSYFIEHFTGAYAHDSFVTNALLSVSGEMTFSERMLNTVANWAGRFFTQYLFWSQSDEFQELYPNMKESYREVLSTSVQLMLVNSHFSLDRPMPYMTNMIEVGGMQIPDKVNPLPETIKTFIDNAKDGVIYFCMGGTLKIKDLDLDKKRTIINGLKRTKLPVIIKWDDDQTIHELVPKEKFYVSNWLPQNDILAHPNVKAYVTHGGLLSTSEAVHHGVPIVGMPIFGDQRMNIRKFIDLGIAVLVDYDTLSVESLSETINQVIDDKSYGETAKELSQRFRDRPMTSVQTAKYWVEYVIRHQTKEFMRSPAMKLNMIQYFNWDVYLTLLLIGLIGAYIQLKVFKWTVCKVCSIFRKKKENKNVKSGKKTQ